MKLDTSSYYPESPLDEFKDNPVPSPQPAQPLPSPQPEASPSESSLIDHLCQIISWVLVPLMMPLYGILMIFSLSMLDHTSLSARVTFSLIIFGFNVIVPAILFVLLKRMGIIRDVGLNDRDERLIPYIITIVCMAGTGFFMAHKGAPLWVAMFFYGGAAAGLVNLIVNFKWKISAHSAAIAGIVALLIRMMRDYYPRPEIFTWLLVWIALAGILGSARIWMGRHTLLQVLAGYVVGFCAVFFMTLIR